MVVSHTSHELIYVYIQIPDETCLQGFKIHCRKKTEKKKIGFFTLIFFTFTSGYYNCIIYIYEDVYQLYAK